MSNGKRYNFLNVFVVKVGISINPYFSHISSRIMWFFFIVIIYFYNIPYA